MLALPTAEAKRVVFIILCLLPVPKVPRVVWGAMGFSEALQTACEIPHARPHLGGSRDAFALGLLFQLLSHYGLFFF